MNIQLIILVKSPASTLNTHQQADLNFFQNQLFDSTLLVEAKEAISSWKVGYKERYFVRFCIIDKVELFQKIFKIVLDIIKLPP